LADGNCGNAKADVTEPYAKQQVAIGVHQGPRGSRVFVVCPTRSNLSPAHGVV
jgi:hypothetical protein